MIHFSSLTTQEVMLVGRKEATSLGDFPSFSNGMMTTTFQIRGQSASWNDVLNMESSSWGAIGLGFVYGVVCFSTSIDPFLSIVMDSAA